MRKQILTSELQVGMICFEPIRTPHGQILAPAKTVLTKQLINKTKLYRVPFIYIDVEEKKPKPTPNILKPIVNTRPLDPTNTEKKQMTYKEETQSSYRRMMSSSEFKGFQVDYMLFLEELKIVFSKTNSDPNYKIDTKSLVDRLATLYLSRNTIIELFDMINQLHSINDSIYAHCVNVALISRMLGRWLHLEQDELDLLTCCGLLHDIGKIAVPDDILNKPGKLSDEEFATIKSHTTLGYEMLQHQTLDSRIKDCVLLHHERYDGSGYPNGLSENDIPDFAAIVGIADVYDAMTAARSYRKPLCAFEVIDKFERDGYQKYHTKYIHTFLNQIATTYQSNRIMLSDGRSAKIVMLNQSKLSKPIIQFDSGDCLDLSSQSNLYISKVL